MPSKHLLSLVHPKVLLVCSLLSFFLPLLGERFINHRYERVKRHILSSVLKAEYEEVTDTHILGAINDSNNPVFQYLLVES